MKEAPIMSSHRFMVNMRRETVSEQFAQGLSPWGGGYLLPGNAAGSIRALTGELIARGEDVLADNGYFDDIMRIRTRFADEADLLYQQVQNRQAELGRSVWPGELGTGLRDEYRALAARARAEGQSVTRDREGTLTKQQLTRTTRFVGAEDITMAVWLALNIEPAYISLPAKDYRRLNESVARTAVRELARLSAAEVEGYYPVASAVDYNTAKDAGRVFADAGLERAAMGFGAYMADNHYSDSVMIGRKRIKLETSMPNRYLRTALVARGFWEGYQHVKGTGPRAFHFLGLGAPIMMGLVALSSWGTPLLTYDATSPIKDAAQGTMYLSSPAPLKVRTRRLALQLASGSREAWQCPCPFCQSFIADHPFDYSTGHAWYAENPGQEPVAADLKPGGRLFDAYPLLSEPAGGPLRAEVTTARMSHNHWALVKITRGLNASSSQHERLDAHVHGLVERYERATNAPRFGAAVRLAYRLCTGDIG